MSYKLKVWRNFLLTCMKKEMSVRSRAISMISVLTLTGLPVWFFTGASDIMGVVISLYFSPCCACLVGAKYPTERVCPTVRALSFFMVCTSWLVVCFYAFYLRVPPESLLLFFAIDCLSIASICVRPSIKEDVIFLKKAADDIYLYVLCAERVAVWPITAVLLVVQLIVLGIEGVLFYSVVVLMFLFFLNLVLMVRKTLRSLRGEREWYDNIG